MVPSLAHKAFQWPKAGSHMSRASLDKSLPAKPPVKAPVKEHLSVNVNAKPGDRRTTGLAAAKSPRTPKTPKTPNSTTSTLTSTMTTIFIGTKKQRFKVNKKLLCSVSPFFSERLEDPSQPRSVSLWLPGESPAMFTLFVEWLNARYSFRDYLDAALMTAQEDGPQPLREMHWAIIRLHLFASHLSLYHLQDSAMDALQDLYLKCNWDVPPSLVSYLYTKCEALPAVRLRRWAVAMMAFSLTGTGGAGGSESSSPIDIHHSAPDLPDPSRFHELIDTLPELATDYDVHMHKMTASGLDVRFKNPQLRIPANRLRNEERAFGFRECSFHSHRATVGERRCPHERKKLRAAAAAALKNPRDGVAAVELSGAKMDAQLSQMDSATAAPVRMPSCMDRDVVPQPLFSREIDDKELESGLKHVRSISSTLK